MGAPTCRVQTAILQGIVEVDGGHPGFATRLRAARVGTKPGLTELGFVSTVRNSGEGEERRLLAHRLGLIEGGRERKGIHHGAQVQPDMSTRDTCLKLDDSGGWRGDERVERSLCRAALDVDESCWCRSPHPLSPTICTLG